MYHDSGSRGTYHYSVRVRKHRFLWGGPGVRVNAPSPPSLALIFRVCEGGEEICFGTTQAGKPKGTELGKLFPGEVFSLNLGDFSGVYVKSDHDVTVECCLLAVGGR